MNLTFENSFIVMPKDCNYLYPMIFGGAFMAQMDLCAASCVTRFLHDSECDSAVTYKVLEVVFHAAAECSDIIFMKAEIVELRRNAVVVSITAMRERRCSPKRDLVATAKFVFVTRKNGIFHPHGLKIS